MKSYIATTWYPLGGTIHGTTDTGHPVTLAVSRTDDGHICLDLSGDRYEFGSDAALTLAAIHNRALAIDDGRPDNLPAPVDWFGTGAQRQVTR